MSGQTHRLQQYALYAAQNDLADWKPCGKLNEGPPFAASSEINSL